MQIIDIKLFQKKPIKFYPSKDFSKSTHKVIAFKDAKDKMLTKEVICLQELINTLSTQYSDEYEKTICHYIDALNGQTLSLNRLIKIIAHNYSIKPVIRHILKCLSYESRERIIVKLTRIWPYHQCLIKRLLK